MFGYHKKLLRVDLGNRKVEVEDLDEKVIRKYVGGLGIEAKILYEETGPETDPLSPQNILMAMTGPFTGTGVPTSGRHHVVARSPLTGFLENRMSGGPGLFTLRRPDLTAWSLRERRKVLFTSGSMRARSRSETPNRSGEKILTNPQTG